MKSPKQQSWWEGETTHGGRSPHLLQFRVKPCTARTRADLGCRDLLAEWGINGGNASGAAETCPHEQWKQYREVVECTFKKNPTSNNKSNLWKVPRAPCPSTLTDSAGVLSYGLVQAKFSILLAFFPLWLM